MVAHSGKFAVINGESTVRNWTVNDLQETKPFVASNTKGATGRREGIYDWNGSFGAYGGQPASMPGDAFSFQGLVAPDADDWGGDGIIYAGTGIIDSVVITWNWGSGDLLSYVANFSGNGLLTSSSGTLSDATTPDPPIIADCKVEYETNPVGPVYAEWPDLAQVVLTLTKNNPSFVNSSTVSSGKVYRGRKAGITDFTIAITDQATLRNALLDRGVDLKLRVYINATEFYQLDCAQVIDYSGITVDRETGAIIQRTVNCGMNGYPSGGSEGQIVLPDLTDWWPET